MILLRKDAPRFRFRMIQIQIVFFPLFFEWIFGCPADAGRHCEGSHRAIAAMARFQHCLRLRSLAARPARPFLHKCVINCHQCSKVRFCLSLLGFASSFLWLWFAGGGFVVLTAAPSFATACHSYSPLVADSWGKYQRAECAIWIHLGLY